MIPSINSDIIPQERESLSSTNIVGARFSSSAAISPNKMYCSTTICSYYFS